MSKEVNCLSVLMRTDIGRFLQLFSLIVFQEHTLRSLSSYCLLSLYILWRMTLKVVNRIDWSYQLGRPLELVLHELLFSFFCIHFDELIFLRLKHCNS